MVLLPAVSSSFAHLSRGVAERPGRELERHQLQVEMVDRAFRSGLRRWHALGLNVESVPPATPVR